MTIEEIKKQLEAMKAGNDGLRIIMDTLYKQETQIGLLQKMLLDALSENGRLRDKIDDLEKTTC
jgi:uncharacterized protein YbaP (TraB family)